MNEPVIFTMSRQFGTNGREIGRQLAKHLGIAYYDKEIMHDIANQMQMDASFFLKKTIEMTMVSFLFPIGISR